MIRPVLRIDRYLFSEILRPSLLGLSFYSFVLVMNQLFLVIRQAFQRGSALSSILEILLLALPKILVFTIPMALLLGVLVGMGRLSSDSEVIALRSAGVSYFRMARPVLAIGILGFAIAAAIYNLAVPWSTARVESLRIELLRTSDPNREIRAGVFFDGIPDTLVYAGEVDRSDPVWPLRKVLIQTSSFQPILRGAPSSGTSAHGEGAPATTATPSAADIAGTGVEGTAGGRVPVVEPAGGALGSESEPSGTRETLICGNRGRIEMSPDGARVTFVVNRGEIHFNEPQSPLAYQTLRFDQPFMTTLPVAGVDALTGRSKKAIAEMTLGELVAELADVQRTPDWRESPARSTRYKRTLMELNWRFSIPFAAPAFCFLAFPLGLINHRGGKASGFALSIVVIMGFWLALTLGRDLANDGKIPVILGAWGPDLLVLAAGLGLLMVRQRRDVFSLPSRIRAWTRAMQSRLSEGHRLEDRPQTRPDAAVFSSTPPQRNRLPVIDVYVARRFLMTFLLVLFSAAALYGVVEFKSLVDSLLQRPFPFALAIKYLGYFTPGMMKIVTPVAALVAAMVTLGTMCRYSEDTALKAAGVSIFRISAPILICTLGLSILYFVTQDYVTPYTNQKASRILDEIEGRASSATVSGTRWIFGKNMRLYGFSDYDPGKRVLQGVSVIDLANDPFRAQRRWWAPRVRWIHGRWIASSGWERDFKDGKEPFVPLVDSPVPWLETPDDFARQERVLIGWDRLAEEMNFWTLRQHIRTLENSGYDTTRLAVALHEKLAFPAAPLVMVLIGLPFAFRTGRRGSLYGLGIALFLVIVYWSCFAVSSALGQESILPPLLAAWSPNLIFALAGSYLFLSTRS